MLPQEKTNAKAIHAVSVCMLCACIPVLVSANFSAMDQEHFAVDKPNQLGVAHETVKNGPNPRARPGVSHHEHNQANTHNLSQLWIEFNLKFKNCLWLPLIESKRPLLGEQK